MVKLCVLRAPLVNFVFISFDLFPDIDNKTHSVSDTLINFVFDLLIIGFQYFIIYFPISLFHSPMTAKPMTLPMTDLRNLFIAKDFNI